ncbi:solute carrier family 26 member 6, like 1 [Paramormyrops kingsleyae]|uniref:solute carrier family 26 member 6, like 1 n=1 Tax=Paramormyrops kingsleyae TaxID=1676925 RepID=UPI003B973C37
MAAKRGRTNYHVDRDILDEASLEELAQKLHSSKKPCLVDRLKHSCRCSLPQLKRRVVGCLPVLYWLPRYSIWDYGMGDLIAGISVGIMQLPQGMAYALLASLPPVFGLYTCLYPVLIYFFFGTSRHISIGPFAVLSIMVGSVVEQLAPDQKFLIMNGTNLTNIVDEAARDSYRVKVAATTTVLGGIIQVVLGLVRFGFVGTYLSEPLVRGYTSAAACHAVVAQLKYIFGLSPRRFNGPLSLVYVLVDICSQLHQIHVPTLVVSSVSLVTLFSAKELNSALAKKLPVPIPVELISIAVATLLSSYTYLNQNYAIGVVGEIPSGLIPPSTPQVSLFHEVIGDAFALAVVGYAISVSLGKTFAIKNGYKVDTNQELVALGLSNITGGFFHCYSVGCSMSRSLVQLTTGGKTQIAGVVSALIVLIAILKLGPLFQELPKAVLSAIVLVNLKGMFKQFYDIITLWKTSKVDLLVWLVTWMFTLLFHLDMGLAASIMFALLTVIFRTQLPKYSVLGQIPGTEIYLDMEKYKEAQEIPGVTIFRSSATVYFANADLYLEALKEKSGINISKMITYKRRQEAKQRRREKRAERRAKREAKRQKAAMKAAEGNTVVFSVEEEVVHWREDDRQDGLTREEQEQDFTMRENGTVFVIPELQREHGSWEYLKGGDPELGMLGSVSELDGDTTTLASSCDDTLSRDLEQISLGSLGKWTWDIHSIILDLSTANFIDTVAIKTMKNIFQDFGEIDVDVYMAGCQATVVEQLETGDFFYDSITKSHLFATVHDAVLYCLRKRGASAASSYDCILDTSCSTKM